MGKIAGLISTPEIVPDVEWESKINLARQGKPEDLDWLVRDKDFSIRLAVARHGRAKDLEILRNDQSHLVREMVDRKYRGLL